MTDQDMDAVHEALLAAREKVGHWGTADAAVLAFVERLAELCSQNTYGRWDNRSATRYLADKVKEAGEPTVRLR